jgi:hypothetical protein
MSDRHVDGRAGERVGWTTQDLRVRTNKELGTASRSGMNQPVTRRDTMGSTDTVTGHHLSWLAEDPPTWGSAAVQPVCLIRSNELPRSGPHQPIGLSSGSVSGG